MRRSSSTKGTVALVPYGLVSRWTVSRLFPHQGTGGRHDIWVLPLSGDRKPFPFVQTAAGEVKRVLFTRRPVDRLRVHPEHAQRDVYVRPFPPSSGQFQISKNGGRYPGGAPTGRRLFFLAPDGTMMAVDIDTAPQFQAGAATGPVQEGRDLVSVPGRQYDVSKDGKRFLVNLPAEQSASAPITVIVNWLATIQH